MYHTPLQPFRKAELLWDVCLSVYLSISFREGQLWIEDETFRWHKVPLSIWLSYVKHSLSDPGCSMHGAISSSQQSLCTSVSSRILEVLALLWKRELTWVGVRKIPSENIFPPLSLELQWWLLSPGLHGVLDHSLKSMCCCGLGFPLRKIFRVNFKHIIFITNSLSNTCAICYNSFLKNEI